MKKVWYKSKTIWVSIITAILGFLVQQGIVDPDQLNSGTVALVMSLVFGALRMVTGSSIGLEDLPTRFDNVRGPAGPMGPQGVSGPAGR